MIPFLSVLLPSLALCAQQTPPQDESVRLKCADYEVVLDASNNWTIKQIFFKGEQFLATEKDAYNGTAVKLADGTWVGDCPGGMTVSSKILSVDGRRKAVKVGETYTAKKKILFERNCSMKVYRFSGSLEVTPDGLTLVHRYRRTRRDVPEKLCAFVLCFDKRFRLFIAQIPGTGRDDVMAKRYDGMFYDNETTLIQEDIRYFALFDTLIHTGVVCYFGGKDCYFYRGESECCCLRDMGNYRRFHFRPAIERNPRAREKLEFVLHIKVFQCPTWKWKKTAATIAGSDWR